MLYPADILRVLILDNTILHVATEDDGTRIDKFISEKVEGLSRNHVQALIDDGLIFVDDKNPKSNYRVKCGDTICLTVPDLTEPEILPENIPLDIIYEDSDLIVVNKPKGMVVHPAAGHYTGTLVNALMYHCSDLSGINGVMRPGIVHRIDKDTSGLLVCAKNDFSHNSLADQLKVHSITRKYVAIAAGRFKEPEGTINAPVGRKNNDRKLMGINYKNGKPAVTHYRVLEQYEKYAYIECMLETGRTHQIRVHMKSIGHPLLGDTVYGGKLSEYKQDGNYLQGQCLHAGTLGFIHPRSNEYMEFSAEPPEYFTALLNKFRG